MYGKKGFTLLEAVIAMFLLAVVMLWTTQSMLVAYSMSGRNQLRDEAVRLVAELLTEARNTPYDSLSAGTTPTYTIARQIRNYDYSYSVNRKVTNAVPGLAYAVEVRVQWTHKGQTYNHTATTIVGNS